MDIRRQIESSPYGENKKEKPGYEICKISNLEGLAGCSEGQNIIKGRFVVVGSNRPKSRIKVGTQCALNIVSANCNDGLGSNFKMLFDNLWGSGV